MIMIKDNDKQNLNKKSNKYNFKIINNIRYLQFS